MISNWASAFYETQLVYTLCDRHFRNVVSGCCVTSWKHFTLLSLWKRLRVEQPLEDLTLRAAQWGDNDEESGDAVARRGWLTPQDVWSHSYRWADLGKHRNTFHLSNMSVYCLDHTRPTISSCCSVQGSASDRVTVKGDLQTSTVALMERSHRQNINTTRHEANVFRLSCRHCGITSRGRVADVSPSLTRPCPYVLMCWGSDTFRGNGAVSTDDYSLWWIIELKPVKTFRFRLLLFNEVCVTLSYQYSSVSTCTCIWASKKWCHCLPIIN